LIGAAIGEETGTGYVTCLADLSSSFFFSFFYSTCLVASTTFDVSFLASILVSFSILLFGAGVDY
jgi:hypothetical protein